MKKKNRTAPYVFAAIGVLVVAVVVVNFTLRGSRYDTAIPVRTITVAKGRLEDRVSGNGTFKPETSVTVTSELSGVAQSVGVKENDYVEEGGLLLKLRDDDYTLSAQKARAALAVSRNSVRQSLVSLRAQYRSAQATLTDAERTLRNNTDLLAAKSITQEAYQKSSDAYDNAKVNLQSSKEQLDLRCGLAVTEDPPLDPSGDDQIVENSPEVEQSLLAVKSADDNVNKCSITAPIAGTVTDVKVNEGDLVSPNVPLVEIQTLGDMLAEIQIDEVDIGKLRVAQSADITSDSLIGQTIKGTVSSIAPTVTSLGSTRVSLVDLRIDRTGLTPGSVIRSGASCTARISTNIKEGALLVPLAAFVTEQNVSSVYLLTGTGKTNAQGEAVYLVSKKQIETGVSDVNDVEVTKGLAEGDVIVAGSLNLLRDGIMVTVRKD